MHKVQNILRITNKKEEQIEKRTEKYCRKERTYTGTNISNFAWSLMKQALQILRWQQTSIFFICTTAVFKESTWRSEPSWLRKCMNITAGKVIIFSPQFAGILKKLTQVLFFINDNLPHSLPEKVFLRGGVKLWTLSIFSQNNSLLGKILPPSCTGSNQRNPTNPGKHKICSPSQIHNYSWNQMLRFTLRLYIVNLNLHLLKTILHQLLQFLHAAIQN